MLETNRIYNIDCIEGMKKMGEHSVDIVLTSPPYNIIRPNLDDRGYDMYQDGMSVDQYIDFTVDVIQNIDNVLKRTDVSYTICLMV